MKRLLILVVMLLSIGLYACNIENHEHDFGSEWQKDETYHWHQCECEGISDKDEHTFDKGIVKTEATCTEKGVLVYTCTVCGSAYEEEIAVKEHRWDEGHVTLEPTESEEGTRLFTCLDCEETKEEKIDKLGHVHKCDESVWYNSDTHHWNLCNCGHKLNEDEHNFDSGVITTEATCTTVGKKTYTCACGYKMTEDIPVKSHTYESDWSFDENGHWHAGECCSQLQKDYAPHSGGTATCTQYALCEVCGREYGKLDDHEYNQQVAATDYLDKEATCTEKATYFYSCICGAKGTATFEYGEYAEHSFTNYISDNNASCELDGTKTAKCDNCEETKTVPDVGSAKGHECNQQVATIDYLDKEATCTEKATYFYSCICGAKGTETFEYGEYKEHSFTNYISDNNASCELDGTKTAKCDNCEETKTVFDVGSAKGHKYNQQVATIDYLNNEATCTEKATYFYSCLCGAKGIDTFEYGELIAHEYNQQVIKSDYFVEKANCQHRELYYYSCSCGAKGTATFEYGVFGEHSWNQGVVTQEPSINGNGVKTYTCSVCAATKTESIPAIVSDISVDKEEIIGLVGEYYYINITNSYNANLIVTNSNSSVLSYTIDSNNHITVKFLKEGSGYLTITTKTGNSVQVDFEALNLTVTTTTEYLEVGKNVSLKLSKNVSAKYTVSNSCASVTSSGVVTANAEGTFDVIITYGEIVLRKRIDAIENLSEITYFDRESRFIRYYGRNYNAGSYVELNNTGSGFEVKFYGTELRATLDAWYGLWLCPENPNKAYTRVSVLIDGATDTTKNVVVLNRGTAKHEYLLASGLSNGWHTVKVLKRTEALATDMTLYSVRTDGYFGVVDKSEKLKIEVYGDSITAGFGNLRPTSNPDYTYSDEQSGLQTYATYAASALGAEINVQARSGIGIYTAGGITEPNHVRHLYGYVNYEYVHKWNFDNYTPDIVIINLGTNDNWHWADTNGDGEMEWQFNQTIFEDEYVKLVQSLATKYGPNTSFVLLNGLMEQDVHKYVANIYNRLKTSIPNKIVTHRFNQVVYGHPLASEQYAASLELVNLIKNNGLDVIHSQINNTTTTNYPITGAKVNTKITVNVGDQLPSYANIVLKGLGNNITMTKSSDFQYTTTINNLAEGDYEISFSLNGDSKYGEIGYPTRIIKVRKDNPNITIDLNTFKALPEDPNPNASTNGWAMSSHFHGTSWKGNSTSSVTITTNTNWMQGFITRRSTLADKYKITANLKATITDYTKSYIGIVPYYKDEANYIVCYLQWNAANSNALKSIGCTGYIDGINIGWHDYWNFANLAPNLASGENITVERDGTMLRISFMGVTQTKQIAYMQGDTKNVGVWAYSDGQPATISSFVQSALSGSISVPTGWSITTTNNASFTNSNGVITLNNTNWLDGFVVKNINLSDNYTVEATIKMANNSYPYASPETLAGIVPYYVDQNNYVVCYLQWNASGTLKSIGCTGKIDGTDIGWYDFWSFAGMNTSLASGQVMKVTRANDTLTITFGGKTESRVISQLYGKTGLKAGVWACTNPATFSNFTAKSK